jgi:hypothetical protein
MPSPGRLSTTGTAADLRHHSKRGPTGQPQIDAIDVGSRAADACPLVLDVQESVWSAASNSNIHDRLRSVVIYYFAAHEQQVFLSAQAAKAFGC